MALVPVKVHHRYDYREAGSTFYSKFGAYDVRCWATLAFPGITLKDKFRELGFILVYLTF